MNAGMDACTYYIIWYVYKYIGVYNIYIICSYMYIIYIHVQYCVHKHTNIIILYG